MLILKLKGGLGNQMFQYATGLSIISTHGGILSLDTMGYEHPSVKNSDTPRQFKLKAFNISASIASHEDILKNKYPLGLISKGIRFISQKIFKQYHQDFCPLYLKKRHRYIEGYFQSEKNFLNVIDLVKEQFTLKFESELFLKYKNQLSNINSVAVHIRRGDYITDKNANTHHGTCSIEYYNKAINMIKDKIENCVFVFFSDDIEWVESQFGSDPSFLYIKEKNLQDYEELILMSNCKHNIIANSSFSWWSAWLNKNLQKIVICPQKWVEEVPNPHPNITPNSWIKI